MRITQKGQVTIPLEVRERHGLLPDTEVDFKEENGRVYLVKVEPSVVAESPFDRVRGRYSLSYSTEEIMKLTRSEESDRSTGSG